jgi:predicted membrane-bound mannosyltransferase
MSGVVAGLIIFVCFAVLGLLFRLADEARTWFFPVAFVVLGLFAAGLTGAIVEAAKG